MRTGDAPESATERELLVEAAEPRHTEALLQLFARSGTPCHCQYWHFNGDKNAWLERLVHAPELNRAAFIAGLAEPAPSGPNGIVGLRDGQAVGWLKLCPADRVPKLYDQRLYKGLSVFSGPREGVLTIGCLLVDEPLRRRGIARALVRGAVDFAEATRASAIEAFPRRAEQAGPAELWMGPASIFLEAGFAIVNDFAPYPVLRYAVTGNAARAPDRGTNKQH